MNPGFGVSAHSFKWTLILDLHSVPLRLEYLSVGIEKEDSVSVAIGLHDCVCRVDAVQVESRIRSLISKLPEENIASTTSPVIWWWKVTSHIPSMFSNWGRVGKLVARSPRGRRLRLRGGLSQSEWTGPNTRIRACHSCQTTWPQLISWWPDNKGHFVAMIWVDMSYKFVRLLPECQRYCRPVTSSLHTSVLLVRDQLEYSMVLQSEGGLLQVWNFWRLYNMNPFFCLRDHT